MIWSPTAPLRAVGPFRMTSPLPRLPAIAYVIKRSPLLRLEITTASYGRIPAASRRSSSTVMLPSYSRHASVTVARWILARSICRNMGALSLLNDARDAEIAVVGVGCVRQCRFLRQPAPHLVRTKHVRGARRRDSLADVGGVQLLELIHVRQNPAELPAEGLGFGLCELQSR